MGQWVNDQVFYDCNVSQDFASLSESHYLRQIFKHLTREIDQKIVIKSSNYANPPSADFSAFAENDLLIYLSEDYRSGIPAKIETHFKHIFKCYVNDTHSKIHPLPLGYEKGVAEFLENKPWDQRTNQVFFSGALNVNRINLYKEVFRLNSIPNAWIARLSRSRLVSYLPMSRSKGNSFIHFSGGFKQGLDARTYGQHLSDSTIALCPKGYHSTETFRHYEALKCGCIVISEKLPQTWMYKDSPIIQLHSWRELNKIIKQLKGDKLRQEALHLESVKWWEERLSPEAVGKYIVEEIHGS